MTDQYAEEILKSLFSHIGVWTLRFLDYVGAYKRRRTVVAKLFAMQNLWEEVIRSEGIRWEAGRLQLRDIQHIPIQYSLELTKNKPNAKAKDFQCRK